MINAIIIEDELKSRAVLRNLLARYCPDVDIVGEASSVKQGIELIDSHQPDLVFLDIELPEQNGFALFEYYVNPDFEVIFTTAYDQFAVHAFRISAIDFLLKPINFLHLKEAVKKVVLKKQEVKKESKIKTLATIIENQKFNKIALPVSNGYEFIDIEEIVYCRAERNYSSFRLINGKTHLVSKPLKYFEELLGGLQFFRINRSIIININCVQGYSRSNSGEVLLSSGDIFSISDNVKLEFLRILNLPK